MASHERILGVVAPILGFLIALILQILLLSVFPPGWLPALGGDPIGRILGEPTIPNILIVLSESALTLLIPFHILLTCSLNGTPVGADFSSELIQLLLQHNFTGIPVVSISLQIYEALLYWFVPFLIGGAATLAIMRARFKATSLPLAGLFLFVIFQLVLGALNGSFVQDYFGLTPINLAFLAYQFFLFDGITSTANINAFVALIQSIPSPLAFLYSTPYTITYLIVVIANPMITLLPYSVIAAAMRRSNPTIRASDLEISEAKQKRHQKETRSDSIPKTVSLPILTPPPAAPATDTKPVDISDRPKPPSAKPSKKSNNNDSTSDTPKDNVSW